MRDRLFTKTGHYTWLSELETGEVTYLSASVGLRRPFGCFLSFSATKFTSASDEKIAEFIADRIAGRTKVAPFIRRGTRDSCHGFGRTKDELRRIRALLCLFANRK